MKDINVVLSPSEKLDQYDVWLVIDILRATTNIVNFFDLGGRMIIPAKTVEEARRIQSMLGKEWLLAGERNMLPPEGFDLGNSPLEYSESELSRHPYAILTTSNGTSALLKASRAGGHVYVACARNAASAAQKAFNSGDSIGILCAGRNQRAGLDDIVCAGLVVDRFLKLDQGIALSDGARVALEIWENCFNNLQRGVRSAQHADLLIGMGMEKDIVFSCQIDKTEKVPHLTEWEQYPAIEGY